MKSNLIKMPEDNRPPLVAMIANYPKGTGYAWWLMQVFWGEISENARSLGWQSVVIYPELNNKLSHSKAGELNLLEEFLSKGAFSQALKIYRLIHNHNICSIYLVDRPFRSWKYLILRFCGVKAIVVHDHTPGDRPPIQGLKGFTKRVLNSISFITADLFIAISPLMRERHLFNARIPDYRIATVTNGIDVPKLLPDAREHLLKKYQLNKESYLVGAVGRLTQYKRLDFAIQSIGRLGQEYTDTCPVLLIAGDGPDMDRLKAIANKFDAYCKVVFTGQLDDVWAFLCGVDTVIHPSAGEGLSLAILEAMAAARPVVLPNLPSVSQTIEHGVCGFIYQEGAIDQVVKLLHQLATNKRLGEKLGMAAREKVVERYQLVYAKEAFKTLVIPMLLQ